MRRCRNYEASLGACAIGLSLLATALVVLVFYSAMLGFTSANAQTSTSAPALHVNGTELRAQLERSRRRMGGFLHVRPSIKMLSYGANDSEDSQIDATIDVLRHVVLANLVAADYADLHSSIFIVRNLDGALLDTMRRKQAPNIDSVVQRIKPEELNSCNIQTDVDADSRDTIVRAYIFIGSSISKADYGKCLYASLLLVFGVLANDEKHIPTHDRMILDFLALRVVNICSSAPAAGRAKCMDERIAELGK